jgi:hypothetical protein
MGACKCVVGFLFFFGVCSGSIRERELFRAFRSFIIRTPRWTFVQFSSSPHPYLLRFGFGFGFDGYLSFVRSFWLFIPIPHVRPGFPILSIHPAPDLVLSFRAFRALRLLPW